MYSIDLEVEQHEDEDKIEKVNINSIYIDSITLNSKCSVITANLNTSSSQANWLYHIKWTQVLMIT